MKIRPVGAKFQADSQWRTERGGGQTPPPPEIPKFYKVEPDCKLSGKCLVFLFQHPNLFKNC
jgi:hypothetical protein